MTKEKKGLSSEHHGELNVTSELFPGGIEAKWKRIDDLRKEYSANPAALQEIDIYDCRKREYRDKLKMLMNAVKVGDTNKEEELMSWFQEHYGDTVYRSDYNIDI